MKKIFTLLFLLPIIVLAQNPFTARNPKVPRGVKPSFAYETIDGRLAEASQNNVHKPLVKPSLNAAKTLKYQLKYSADLGLPIWLNVFVPPQEKGFGIQQTENQFTIQTVLSELPNLFQFKECTLRKVSEQKDDLGFTHYTFQQYHKGVKIAGGVWKLHAKDDVVVCGNGRIYPELPSNHQASITQEQAIYTAQQKAAKDHPFYEHQGLTVIDKSPKAELQLDYDLTDVFKPVLVYRVEVRPTDLHHYTVWIDATTGKVLKMRDELCSIDGPKTANASDLNNQTRTINTYQIGSSYYLIDASRNMYNSGQSRLPDESVGAIWTIDARNTAASSIYHVTSNNNQWSDRSAVSAHYNAGLAYEYYRTTHNRNSINGSGGTIVSVVNVADQGGGSLENAYWNGQAMFYGNGGTVFKPLAGALDVAGHELTHGVISNSANLEYQDQSGAINESMADVFGAMIDRDDWKMGEDVVKPGVFPGGALRDLQNPNNGGSKLGDNGWQPKNMSEFYTGSQDNGGVHINSGIVNRAFYLVAENIGKAKAEKIWYRALTIYLTTKSEFLDLRYATEKAASDLYGNTEVEAIKTAFNTVEIYDPNANGGSGGSGDDDSDIPANPGDEFIISLDVDLSNPNTFYKSTPVPNGWQALTTRTPQRKASVTDKGDYMYYISNSNLLYRIQLTSPYTETNLSNDLWDNVAISKDGNLLAAITTEIDSSIWVYNFSLSSWKQFKLYNPTYTQGVNNGNVLYADAIEFDNTGQYILYDAYNVIKNASGNDIDYWDVGEIRVWNKSANNWGDGRIEKVFTQLPEDVSIGNATYAKNSPSIIAFDYIDGSTGDFAVLATNTVTNTTNTIFQQDKLGYPNFSNKDDKLIFDAENTANEEVIGVQDLAEDKISRKAGTSPSVLIPDAKWGTWFANGTRSLLSDKKEILSFAFPSLNGSPKGTIQGNTIAVEVPAGTNLSRLTPTFTHSADAVVSVNNEKQVSGVTSQNFTSDVLYRVTAQDGSIKNYVVKVSMLASTNDISHQILVYPNPTENLIRVESSVQLNGLYLQDLNGKTIKQTNDKTLDLSKLNAGLFILKIETQQGIIYHKIIKK
jgi:Zn-dependent metalloprotease